MTHECAAVVILLSDAIRIRCEDEFLGCTSKLSDVACCIQRTVPALIVEEDSGAAEEHWMASWDDENDMGCAGTFVFSMWFGQRILNRLRFSKPQVCQIHSFFEV